MKIQNLNGLKYGFLLISLIGFTAYAADPAGSIVLVKGDVTIKDKGSKIVASTKDGKLRAIKPGAPFFVGEKIVTGSDGRVKLKFVDGGNEVVLGTGTELLIESAATAAKSAGTSLKLAQGEIRSTVNKKYSGQGDDVFQVKTANAVAGVRGTVFTSMFKNGASKFGTEQGSVFVGNAAGQGVLVGAGQMTVATGMNVEPAKPLASDPEMAKSVEQNGGSADGDSKGDKKDKNQNGEASEKGDEKSDKGEKKDDKKSNNDPAASSDKKENGNGGDASADKGDKKGGPEKGPASKEGGSGPVEKAEKKDGGGPGAGPGGPGGPGSPGGERNDRTPATFAGGGPGTTPPPIFKPDTLQTCQPFPQCLAPISANTILEQTKPATSTDAIVKIKIE